eukprot:tig00021591_g22806.t1
MEVLELLLPVPTISVGNVTWAGGKTPMTEYIARQALARASRPSSSSGLRRDECRSTARASPAPRRSSRRGPTAPPPPPPPAELRGRVPRPRAPPSSTTASSTGGRARAPPPAPTAPRRGRLRERGAGQLERDLDLLMLSCLDPSRRPPHPPRHPPRARPSGVARAHVVALHHSDLVPLPEVERIAAQVAEWNPRAVVVRTRFEPEGLRHLAGPPLPPLPAPPGPGPGPGPDGAGLLRGLPAFAFAGVGCPAAFLATARVRGGAGGVGPLPDHRPFAPRELAALAARAAAAGRAAGDDGEGRAPVRGALRGLEREGRSRARAALAGRLAVSEARPPSTPPRDRPRPRHAHY